MTHCLIVNRIFNVCVKQKAGPIVKVIRNDIDADSISDSIPINLMATIGVNNLYQNVIGSFFEASTPHFRLLSISAK